MALEWIYIINVVPMLYAPYALYRYYKYFDVYPIRMWNSPIMLLSGIMNIIHQVVVLIAQLTPSINVWISSIPMTVSDSVLTDCFILQAIIIYFKFEIVSAQEQCNTHDKAKLRDLDRLLHRAKFFVSKQFAMLFLGSSLFFILFCVFGWIGTHPEVGMVPCNECQNGQHPDCETLVQIVMFKTALAWALAVVIAFKLKAVFDSIGIKQTLKKISIIFFLANVIYFVLLTAIPVVDGYAFSTTFLLFGYQAVFHYSITVQARAAERALSNIAEDQSLIHQFLLNPTYFDAFFKHAKTEFNVENLSFWKDVYTLIHEGKNNAKRSSNSTAKRLLLKATASSATPGSTPIDEAGSTPAAEITPIPIMSYKDTAVAIYEKYVVDGAMLQVNLPDQIFAQIHKDIATLKEGAPDNQLDPTKLYIPAMKSIEKLMNDDMLPRFKKTALGKIAWDEFEKALNAHQHVTSNGGISIEIDNGSSNLSIQK